MLRMLVIRQMQALLAVDVANDCVETRGPVWSTGGKTGVAVVRADPLRLAVKSRSGCNRDHGKEVDTAMQYGFVAE